MKPDKDQDHFVKQRRNFILISLFIIFYEAAGLSIQEINFFGNKTTIDNPEIVTKAIYLIFAYFFWRYYTACREVSGVLDFFSACNSWAEQKGQNYLNEKYTKSEDEHTKYTVHIAGRDYLILKYLIVKKRTREFGPVERTESVHALKYIAIVYTILSYFFIALKTSKFSEYILPYILGLIAIWTISKDWIV